MVINVGIIMCQDDCLLLGMNINGQWEILNKIIDKNVDTWEIIKREFIKNTYGLIALNNIPPCIKSNNSIYYIVKIDSKSNICNIINSLINNKLNCLKKNDFECIAKFPVETMCVNRRTDIMFDEHNITHKIDIHTQNILKFLFINNKI